MSSSNFTKSRLKRNEIRRDLKVNRIPQTAQSTINSPLLKYTDSGLKCLICGTAIKSETVWKAHTNSKLHKQKVEAAKLLKIKVDTTQPIAIKRKTEPESSENANRVIAATAKEPQRTSLKDDDAPQPTISKTQIAKDGESALPEKFFDNPTTDAKIRNTEYKDGGDEWENFQREIKEASLMSNTIIAEEIEEVAADKQIDEIDEQMHRWSRVLLMEKKLKAVLEKQQNHKASNNTITDSDSLSSNEDDTEFDEFTDWRAKKFS